MSLLAIVESNIAPNDFNMSLYQKHQQQLSVGCGWCIIILLKDSSGKFLQQEMGITKTVFLTLREWFCNDVKNTENIKRSYMKQTYMCIN